MKIKVLAIALFLPIVLFSQSNDPRKKILMVVSSYGKEMGSVRPGFEFDEFSQAYLIFKQNGLVIDVASPKGGKVEADKYNEEKAYNKSVLENQTILDLLNKTISTSSLDPSIYDAIYIVGGKGAMFDLPYDPSLQDIILNLYQREGTVIASVCHGPASFVNVKDDNDYIINGVEITSFCNIEEELFGKKWVTEFPFKLEDKIKSRGAIFSQTDFMLCNVSVSGKFITGQNPFSTAKSAEEVVKALGIVPANRVTYKDEKSAYLIQDILNGNKTIEWSEKELKNNTEAYDIPLIAVYGYYKILSAEEDIDALSKSVELIELTSPYFFNEKLQFLLAKSYISLGDQGRAKEILNDLNSKGLLKEQVAELLKEIG